MSAPLLDRNGRPLERERVRKAIGFVDRTLKAEESEALTGLSVRGGPAPWRESGCEAGGRGWRREPA